ncbi:MAG: DNA-binding response regulator [Planctomycetes bacterium RBG_16_55_9]|nr:MAG: DNA-binding response regulator [Planctomycetes bacterium RBG_16_55_9]
MSIRIVLADDHAIVRYGLSKSIQQEEGMEVVGQARNGLGAIDLVKELSPDVVVMDISMPDINGMDATREIVRDFPEVKIVALSMHSAKRFVREMFKAGASGYLLKDCEFDELAMAIRTVMTGRSYLSPEITDVVVDEYVQGPAEEKDSVFTALTKRERQVLQLLAEGQTTKQVGMKLNISPKTVEAHRLRIMGKIDIDNIAQLTKYAIQEGLTSAEP